MNCSALQKLSEWKSVHSSCEILNRLDGQALLSRASHSCSVATFSLGGRLLGSTHPGNVCVTHPAWHLALLWGGMATTSKSTCVAKLCGFFRVQSHTKTSKPGVPSWWSLSGSPVTSISLLQTVLAKSAIQFRVLWRLQDYVVTFVATWSSLPFPERTREILLELLFEEVGSLYWFHQLPSTRGGRNMCGGMVDFITTSHTAHIPVYPGQYKASN